MEHPHLDKWT